MNWLVLIAVSIVSSAIILYALWPGTTEKKHRKKIISLLVFSAFAFPAGLNYYFIDQSQKFSSVIDNKPINYGAFSDPVWTGPMSGKPQPTSDQMSMSSVTARLEAKLRQNPDDISGWILLGRSFLALGQPQRAITLFEERLDENPDNIDLLLSYGETLTELNQGNVSDKARALFEEAAILEASNPRAEYNITLYEIQQGQAQKAYDRLNRLLEGAPTNAPWLSQIKQRMDVAGEQLNNSTTRRPMKQPSQEQVMEIAGMSPEDQNAFIISMVDGLAEDLKENPDDLEGWLNLARSYGVLQEWQKSADSYKQASQLSPEDEKIKGQYKAALSKAADN